MVWSRRRKGKQASGRNTPVSPTHSEKETAAAAAANTTATATATANNNDDEDAAAESKQTATSSVSSTTIDNVSKEDTKDPGKTKDDNDDIKETDLRDSKEASEKDATDESEQKLDKNESESRQDANGDDKGAGTEDKQNEEKSDVPLEKPITDDEQGDAVVEEVANDKITPNPSKVPNKSTEPQEADPADGLVLTSEKRRGVYECDYCHSDISQLPRIRCAICPDFDLCLDCFATTDHEAAMARLKAAATAQSELQADGITSTLVSGISSAAALSKGYKVCDSTRYPIFGSSRLIKRKNNANNNNSAEGGKEDSTENNDDEDDMDIDEIQDSASSKSTQQHDEVTVVNDDPKSNWTAEEDLRLIDAIKTHGLGNWVDISEAIGGNGSFGKTPKRCMERYFDDFLGRYGHILPQYTLVEDKNDSFDNDPAPAATAALMEELEAEDSIRASKRRSAQLNRLPSNMSVTSGSTSGRSRKRYKVTATSNLPGYDQVWPNPYLPSTDVVVGQEVARDLSTKNELAFVKATLAASSKAEADKIREEWLSTKMNQIGAPTVLPPRPEDTETLPGAELAGFMPRRGEFDLEHENDAEQALADMEFLVGDTEQEKQLKVQVLQIYYKKQEEREKRKRFILTRNLYDYRKYVKDELALPQDYRDLKHRMRLFERFHTPEEHHEFLNDIILAKNLRKEIAKLQTYRYLGITSLAEAERFELDKTRRQYHIAAVEQKDAEIRSNAVAASAGASAGNPNGPSTKTTATVSVTTSQEPSAGALDSLWKKYRTSDRKARRSLNRVGSVADSTALEKERPVRETLTREASSTGEAETEVPSSSKPEEANTDEKEASKEADDSMEVDHIEKANEAESKTEVVSTKDQVDTLDLSTSPGYDLLSKKERNLCLSMQIYPMDYLRVKQALIQESFSRGLLDKEGGRRSIMKLDIERRGPVVDFLLRAGWISSRAARTVTPPPIG